MKWIIHIWKIQVIFQTYFIWRLSKENLPIDVVLERLQRNNKKNTFDINKWACEIIIFNWNKKNSQWFFQIRSKLRTGNIFSISFKDSDFMVKNKKYSGYKISICRLWTIVVEPSHEQRPILLWQTPLNNHIFNFY